MTDQIEKFSETFVQNGIRITYQTTTFRHKNSHTMNITVRGIIETLEDKSSFAARFAVTKEIVSSHQCYYKTYAAGIPIPICSCGRPYYKESDINLENCLTRSTKFIREKIGDLCDW